MERRQSILVLQLFDPGFPAFHPRLPHGLDPFRQNSLDVGSFLGHVFVLRRVDFADNQVRDVGCEVELVFCTHLRGDKDQGTLRW